MKKLIVLLLVMCAVPAFAGGVRMDNRGEYLSPFTADETLAKWVDTAIKSEGWSKVGGGVGMAVGAYAGKKAGDELLKNVPFGGVIGGIGGSLFGKKAGAKAARASFIKMSGGMDNIRNSSEISSDNCRELASYMYQNNSNHQNYNDALSAMYGLYPKFKKCYKKAVR